MIARLLLSLLLTIQLVSAIPYKKIPKPILENTESKLAPGQIFKIYGSGFIKNYPQAHKVKLIKKNKKFRAKTLEANSDNLTLMSPGNIKYGDYDLEIRIKTKYLRSKKSRLKQAIKLRPAAPPKPELKYQVAQDPSETKELTNNSRFNNSDLNFKVSDLKLGINSLVSYYTLNGWTSLESEGSDFYYLPEAEMQKSLELESESPLKTLAISKDLKHSFNVSDLTKITEKDLSKHFFLNTPHVPKYLEYIMQLSPVFIEKLHVKADEYAILRNRSSESFLLENCHLYDSIKKRYSFNQEDQIPAKEFIKLEANLGLNDSSPDSMTLECNEETIDSFNYKKIDTEGFAIREAP